MRLNNDVTDIDSLPALTVRWSRLRNHAQAIDSPVPFIAEGLPLRARRLLEATSAATVQELLALDPEELIERDNVGRTTLAALVARAEESLPPVTVALGAPDFVEVVDMILGGLAERARRIVIARFERHTRSIDVARDEKITRERVRQIEEKFVARVTSAAKRHKLLPEDVMSDGLVEFEELTSGGHDAREAPDLYVSLARAVLTGGDSYVDVERFYSGELQLLASEIRNDDEFILARLSIPRALEMARVLTPALSELGPDELWTRLKSELRATEAAGRLLGRKPQVGRIIRALLRSAEGPVAISLLVNQLRLTLASYGEPSYFDEVRLRNKLFSMEGVHLSDERTASLSVPDPTVARKWAELAVDQIRRAGKLYSLVRFLDQHEDAPFDAFGLASLLRSDDRVVHVGRRLYASADYEIEGSIRIAALIEAALKQTRKPMTRRELLSYVQDKRDVICTQIENYFARVPSIVLYTTDIAGLVPLDRDVMLEMLEREACVISLLRTRDDGRQISLAELWLPSDEEPDLTAGEEKAIVTAARRWKTARVSAETGGLFFSMKEDA